MSQSNRCAARSPAATSTLPMAAHHPEGWDAGLAALASGAPALVWRRIIGDTETSVGAGARLIEAERGDFLLESVQGGEVRGRYSLLGLDPDLVFRASGNHAEINPKWQQDRAAFASLPGDCLTQLRALVASCRIDVPAALPRALAMLVGYFGYETVGLVEKLPRAAPSDLVLPDMVFVRPTLILVFDRLTDEVFVVAPVWPSAAAAAQAMEAAADRIRSGRICSRCASAAVETGGGAWAGTATAGAGIVIERNLRGFARRPARGGGGRFPKSARAPCGGRRPSWRRGGRARAATTRAFRQSPPPSGSVR